ncbi:MAG: hypothetical protein ABGZ53_23570 [Fuerstiella sp.]
MGKLANVHKGVSCVYYGLFLIVGTILVAFVGGGVLMVSPAVGAVLVLGVVPIMFIAGTILGLVGRIMCLSVPDDFSAVGVIYAAVICDVTVVLISAAGWIVDLPELVSSLSSLLTLASTILFLVFLMKISAYIDDNASLQRAGNVLLLLIATFVVVIVGVFLPPLLIVVLLMVIVGFIMYVLLLMGLMKSLKAA